MKRIFAAILAVVLFMAVNMTWVEASVPDPTEYFYVNDYANVISAETREYIIGVNDDLFARTGAQIVVTTVNFLNGMDMETYSLEMFNAWKIGSSKNNGLLMLLAIAEDNYYLQPGSDLRKKLSAAESQSILDDYCEPSFAEKDYDKAVKLTFDQLAARIDQLYASTGTNPNATTAAGYSGSAANTAAAVTSSWIDGFWGFIQFILVIVVVIAVLAIIFGSIGRRGYYDGAPRRRGIGGFFWGYGMGRAMRPPHHHHHPPTSRPPAPGPRPGSMSGPSGGFGNGPRSGGGGFSSGGGIGRSSGGFGGSRSMGGGISRGGGMSRGGGGGMSRGGGVGRK